MLYDELISIGEYAAAGMFEAEERSLFYRKSLGIRRFYEHCTIPQYSGQMLYPSGTWDKGMKICPSYISGLESNCGALTAVSDELAEKLKELKADSTRYCFYVPREHQVAGNMYTHSMPNYERILSEGLLSYAERVRGISDIDMREGLLHVIEGIKCYIARCVDYLESVGADEKLISALRRVPLNPAEDFYEAVVAWNFVLYLDNCDNLGCVASGLAPYYNGEDALPLLRNLYDNLDMNGGYSMAIGMVDSPLMLQCLEASKGKRRPMIELFVDDDTPDEIWEKSFEVIKSGNGQPAFYNKSAITDGFKKKFPCISDDDLKKFCGGGCTESMFAGLSNVGSLDAGINLLLILEKTIYAKLETAKTFEEFYEDYIADVRAVVEDVCEKISLSQLERAKHNPLPMRTLLIDDCIENGLDYNNGGARYKWSIISFAGMINIIDSMLVLRDFVFETKRFAPSELIERLKQNDKAFLAKAATHDVCFGNGNEAANAFANRISADIFSMLDDKKPAIGEGFIPASIQFNSQVSAGKAIGATPDGRECGSPLCDSLAAILGKDTEGPTALLQSVASLDLKRALGIPVLSFNITPDFDVSVLKGLILGYMKLGGIQIQITCVSAETLLDAYENPEKHRNLIVRVGGYSEYFTALSDSLRLMIINRTIRKI